MAKAQPVDSIKIAIDSLKIDRIPIVLPPNSIVNSELLDAFFAKLNSVKSTQVGKINIVHVGDSHIQGDAMTGKIRQILQQNFGNAGRGFVFPYRLANTNGSHDVNFNSNVRWKSYRNIYPFTKQKLGLSGISLSTQNNNFYIELKAGDAFFNTLKIITPGNDRAIGVASEKIIVSEEIKVAKKIVHRVKRGETLSGLASKYNVLVAEIKKANHLKKDKIQKGKVLKIPTSEMVVKSFAKHKFIPLEMVQNNLYQSFKSDLFVDRLYLIPNKLDGEFNLNGLVLENNNAGILYHNIGVNGSKFLDYNKYPQFFEQLKVLQPDLMIISLGTNESFGKISVDDYLLEMQLFIKNVKEKIGDVPFIVTTPPPSLFKKRNPNTIVAQYTQKLLESAANKQFAVWDLFAQFGGLYAVETNFEAGLMTMDKIHYTHLGYEKQGILFSEAFMDGYQNFLKKINLKF